MKIKDVLSTARKDRSDALMVTFKEWVRDRFGRDIKPGDVFELHAEGETWESTVSKDGYVIDFGQPMLSTTNAHYFLGKSRLTKFKAKLL